MAIGSIVFRNHKNGDGKNMYGYYFFKVFTLLVDKADFSNRQDWTPMAFWPPVDLERPSPDL